MTGENHSAENVFLLVLDTVRARETYVNNTGLTPNLETLAQANADFCRAIAPAAWTLPSHASIFTGLYPSEHGTTTKNRHINPNQTLLPEHLQQAGFRTGLFTANAYLTESFGLTRGFDTNSFIRGEDNRLFQKGLDPIKFIQEREHDQGPARYREIIDALKSGPTHKNLANSIYFKLKNLYEVRFGNPEPSQWDEEAITRAMKFIDEVLASDERFFATVNLIGAHAPWPYDQDLLSQAGIEPEEIAPESRWREVSDVSEAQWSYAAGEVELDKVDRKLLTKLYRSWVRRVDEYVGQVVNYLEKEGILEDTLLIVTSDHGEQIAKDGVLGHTVSVDQDVAHVPLVVAGPNVEEKCIREPVSLTGLHDMILDCCGMTHTGSETLLSKKNRGSAYIETYGVTKDTLPSEYARVADRFGPRFSLYTTSGSVEYREDTGEVFGDESLDELEEFRSQLDSNLIQGTANDVPEEVEQRLQELGYK